MKRYLLFSHRLYFCSYECISRKFLVDPSNSTYGIEKIEMKNMSQCEEQGKQYTKSSSIPRYMCLIGYKKNYPTKCLKRNNKLLTN